MLARFVHLKPGYRRISLFQFGESPLSHRLNRSLLFAPQHPGFHNQVYLVEPTRFIQFLQRIHINVPVRTAAEDTGKLANIIHDAAYLE